MTIRNRSEYPLASAIARIKLLSDGDSISEREVSLGALSPGEDTSVSVTFNEQPETVTGRQIGFEGTWAKKD
ncbi:hypothetical protein EFA46_015870 (plasmid) [Halarchaeum sp. CBA1220]|uniref:hypothetical protein n=1 Tax=Halarchaeum sp. CBA1220 TaxID=1853682 RepID=UPI0011CE013B|nr:hypothetical protein [Halarchaeum sp. CBA1220]QLC35735.1 hypothetical protein EFA46_015870 [Halarchaeum sp. CBA1220]